jgi:alpha-beta hydrolase superfamily lysophospholipase
MKRERIATATVVEDLLPRSFDPVEYPAADGGCTVVEYPSANGINTVTGYYYDVPDGAPRAIVQIAHGMQEYLRRYDPLARYLTQHGYAVCGNDHLGHGATSGEDGIDGYFAEENGAECVLADLFTMSALAQKRWPGVPLVLMGHSMGSFFARWYAELHSCAPDGLILSGTAGPNPAAAAGLAVTSLLTFLKGSTAFSPLVEKLAFGSYNARIENAVTGKEWVTGGTEALAAYIADPKCGFPFTLNGFHGLMTVLKAVSRKAWPDTLPKDLPVYLFAGEEDPVGAYGKGVRTVYDSLLAAGMRDVSLKLYPGCRHEVHNEAPAARAQCYADLKAWLDARF